MFDPPPHLSELHKKYRIYRTLCESPLQKFYNHFLFLFSGLACLHELSPVLGIAAISEKWNNLQSMFLRHQLQQLICHLFKNNIQEKLCIVAITHDPLHKTVVSTVSNSSPTQPRILLRAVSPPPPLIC